VAAIIGVERLLGIDFHPALPDRAGARPVHPILKIA